MNLDGHKLYYHPERVAEWLNKETYEKIHTTKPSDFKKVLNNIEYAVKYKQDNKLKTTICRPACRLNNINRYLWQLKNSIEHINFI